VGKTTLLTHLIETDIRDGRGVIVFDPLGDLTELVSERIPQQRLDEVVVVDPTEAERPVGFNVIATDDPHRMADFLVGVMSRLFASSWGPRTADVLRASLLTLSATPGSTLADVPDLLTDPALRRRLLPPVMNDRVLAGFWTWFEGISEGERSSVIAPLLNKVRAVVLRPEAIRALCHPEGQLDLTEVFKRRHIVIIRLAKGLLGEDTAALIGGLVLARLWQEILARAAVDSASRSPVFVYLDEFQDYLRLPVGMGDMLAQARGMGVGLVVAHQHLGQLPDQVRRDVLANVGSRVIFQTISDDSRVLARDLEPHLTSHDLRGLAAREIVARIALPDRVLAPVTGRTLPPSQPIASADEVQGESRARFGRPLTSRGQRPAETPIGRRARKGQR
jgi:type IV secretory pathway TraG/TraD family ATPase VirD4